MAIGINTGKRLRTLLIAPYQQLCLRLRAAPTAFSRLRMNYKLAVTIRILIKAAIWSFLLGFEWEIGSMFFDRNTMIIYKNTGVRD